MFKCPKCGEEFITAENALRCPCSRAKQRKTNWSLMKEFWPILKECADVLTYADNGKHPKNSFLKETTDHQLECMMRHIYEDEYVDRINKEDGGYHHLAHAVIRLLMYYRLKQVQGRSLEEVR